MIIPPSGAWVLMSLILEDETGDATKWDFCPAVSNIAHACFDGRCALSSSGLLTEIKNHRSWEESLRLPLFIIYSAAWHMEACRAVAAEKMHPAWREKLILPVSQYNKTTVRTGRWPATLAIYVLITVCCKQQHPGCVFMMGRTSVNNNWLL